MSRQFNPVIPAYNNMQLNKEPLKEKKQTKGLLAPKDSNMIKDEEDLSSPLVRVKKHMQAIQERRMVKNVS